MRVGPFPLSHGIFLIFIMNILVKVNQIINKVEDEIKIFIKNCLILNPKCDMYHHPPIELPIVINRQNRMNKIYNISPNVILPSIIIMVIIIID